jgi:hypothetical protein
MKELAPNQYLALAQTSGSFNWTHRSFGPSACVESTLPHVWKICSSP